MHPQQTGDVVDVVVEVGDEEGSGVVERGGQPGDVLLVAARQYVVVVEVLRHPSGQLGAELAAQGRLDVVGFARSKEIVVDAVDHDSGEREPALLQRAAKPDRLVDRLGLRRC